MADRPKDPDDRRYGWLYGEGGDDEETRRIPMSSRRPGERRSSAGGEDPDPTRLMPVGDRGGRAGHDRPRRPSPPPPPPPRRAAPPPSRRARSGKRPRWGRILLLVLLAWLVFLVAVPLWALSRIEKVDAEPNGERPDNTLGTTYLLVGSDSREGLSRKERKKLSTGNASGARTDTILLLHEPAFGGETLLISVPRDSIVDIPRVGSGQKINAAYAYGGPDLLVETVENETGLYVDDYVEIGFGGFVNLVDAVGGVEICPKQAIEDPKAGLDIPQGCQQADGATALGYARSREYSTGDIGRGQAQREVIGKVASKAASPWTFINPFRYFAVNKAGSEAVRVGEDVGPIDMARFAWAVHKVSGKDGKTCTVPIADLAVNWDDERASALFDRIREGETDQIGRRLCTKTGLPR